MSASAPAIAWLCTLNVTFGDAWPSRSDTAVSASFRLSNLLDDDFVIFAPQYSPFFGLFSRDDFAIAPIVYAETGRISQIRGCRHGDAEPSA